MELEEQHAKNVEQTQDHRSLRVTRHVDFVEPAVRLHPEALCAHRAATERFKLVAML